MVRPDVNHYLIIFTWRNLGLGFLSSLLDMMHNKGVEMGTFRSINNDFLRFHQAFRFPSELIVLFSLMTRSKRERYFSPTVKWKRMLRWTKVATHVTAMCGITEEPKQITRIVRASSFLVSLYLYILTMTIFFVDEVKRIRQLLLSNELTLR